jgi:uncharacterized protein (TIGR03435 family)
VTLKSLLRMMLIALACDPSAAARLQAQSVADRPEFEAASIRPHAGRGTAVMVLTPSRVTITNMPVQRLIGMAYNLREDEIEGGPAWVRSEGYDIQATGEAKNGEPLRQMLQRLLEDRFQLKVHPEVKQGPVYELVRAQGRLKMPQQGDGSCVDPEKPHAVAGPGDQPILYCNWWDERRNGRLVGTGIYIWLADLALRARVLRVN